MVMSREIFSPRSASWMAKRNLMPSSATTLIFAPFSSWLVYSFSTPLMSSAHFQPSSPTKPPNAPTPSCKHTSTAFHPNSTAQHTFPSPSVSISSPAPPSLTSTVYAPPVNSNTQPTAYIRSPKNSYGFLQILKNPYPTTKIICNFAT